MQGFMHFIAKNMWPETGTRRGLNHPPGAEDIKRKVGLKI